MRLEVDLDQLTEILQKTKLSCYVPPRSQISLRRFDADEVCPNGSCHRGTIFAMLEVGHWQSQCEQVQFSLINKGQSSHLIELRTEVMDGLSGAENNQLPLSVDSSCPLSHLYGLCHSIHCSS